MNKLQKFLETYINKYADEIQNEIGIDDFPDIYISDAMRRSKYFNLAIFEFYKGAMPKLNFNMNHTFDSCKLFRKGEEYGIWKNVTITLYLYRIKDMFKINLISKIVLINIFIHELTHYRQYLDGEKFEGEKVNSSTDKASFKLYRSINYEKEARKAGLNYILKNIFKIISCK